jgi:hypothetical protein
MNDLKFTTAGEYMSSTNSHIDEITGRRYFVNEAGLRVDALTGDLLPTVEVQAQCLAP